MRECGECTECCTWLMGSAYGHEFGKGKSCKFLCESGCSVHKVRPNVCRGYFCAWAQEILPIEMRPDKCGFLISVENGESGQYLKVISTNGGEINNDTINWLKNWSSIMNTPVFYFEKDRLIEI